METSLRNLGFWRFTDASNVLSNIKIDKIHDDKTAFKTDMIAAQNSVTRAIFSIDQRIRSVEQTLERDEIYIWMGKNRNIVRKYV